MSQRNPKKKTAKKSVKKPLRTKKARPVKGRGAGAKPAKKQSGGVNKPHSSGGGKSVVKTAEKSGKPKKKSSPATEKNTARSAALSGKAQKGTEVGKKKVSARPAPRPKKKKPTAKASSALKKEKGTSPKPAGETTLKPSGTRPPSRKKPPSPSPKKTKPSGPATDRSPQLKTKVAPDGRPPRLKKAKPKTAKDRPRPSKTAVAPAKQTPAPGKATPSAGEKKPLAEKTKGSKKPSHIKDLNTAKKELENVLKKETEEKLILRNIEGKNYCSAEDCGFSAVVEGYCRLHYIGRWENIVKRKKILETGFLEKQVELLASNHSTGILNFLLQDLREGKTFDQAVKAVLEDSEDTDSEEDIPLD